MVQKRVVVVLLFFIFCVPKVVCGQAGRDSLEVIITKEDSLIVTGSDEIEVVIDTLENRPNTAALYSACDVL